MLTLFQKVGILLASSPEMTLEGPHSDGNTQAAASSKNGERHCQPRECVRGLTLVQASPACSVGSPPFLRTLVCELPLATVWAVQEASLLRSARGRRQGPGAYCWALRALTE